MLFDLPALIPLEMIVERLRAQDRRGRLAAQVEKEGVFTGSHATNPFSRERIPIWVGNFVLMGYGTGAIMAVPAHDQRDFEFARKYGLPVRAVIQPEGGGLDGRPAGVVLQRVVTEEAHGAHVAAGGHRSGHVVGPPDDAGADDRIHVRQQRGLQRRPPPQPRLRLVGTAVGND